MYDYKEAMAADIREYLEDKNNYDIDFSDYNEKDDFFEDLYEKLWIEDSVTGNASGSYTFNSAEAREYVQENMDLAKEALQEFCIEASTIGEKFLNEEWEYLDVTIRCYILAEVLQEIAEELEDAGAFDAEEEEEK